MKKKKVLRILYHLIVVVLGKQPRLQVQDSREYLESTANDLYNELRK